MSHLSQNAIDNAFETFTPTFGGPTTLYELDLVEAAPISIASIAGGLDAQCDQAVNLADLTPLTSASITLIPEFDHNAFVSSNSITFMDLLDNNLPLSNSPITDAAICPAPVPEPRDTTAKIKCSGSEYESGSDNECKQAQRAQKFREKADKIMMEINDFEADDSDCFKLFINFKKAVAECERNGADYDMSAFDGATVFQNALVTDPKFNYVNNMW